VRRAYVQYRSREAGQLLASQQCFSFTPIQHQPAVFFSHNKSAPVTSHRPAERGARDEYDGRFVPVRCTCATFVTRAQKRTCACLAVDRSAFF
jgi:hypothetical protein